MKKRQAVLAIAAVLLVTAGVVWGFTQEKGSEERPSVAEEVNGQEKNEEPPALEPVQGEGRGTVRWDELSLLARVVAAEAESEPYVGKVAVAAVIINRVEHPAFPRTLAGVVYQPYAFESVSNGRIWRVSNLSESQRAAQAALNGWDPTYGSIYFWNPSKPVSGWIWSRQVVTSYGRHVFAR